MCLKVVILSGLKSGNNCGSCYKENYNGPLWKGTKISVPRGGLTSGKSPSACQHKRLIASDCLFMQIKGNINSETGAVRWWGCAGNQIVVQNDGGSWRGLLRTLDKTLSGPAPPQIILKESLLNLGPLSGLIGLDRLY